ncbi:RDD family protein [Cellulomonas cellasea]|uniref:Mce-associated membrane protein n=1 Tax=Cellulomonas cellasea TaxID=43670 RepID=A0A7W4UIC4_9CELL|nr:RDD family protein [Cellulomonas cellasea]MBB2924690.1 Mce-associated membrane protein [Cellulomonas cellasea]
MTTAGGGGATGGGPPTPARADARPDEPHPDGPRPPGAGPDAPGTDRATTDVPGPDRDGSRADLPRATGVAIAWPDPDGPKARLRWAREGGPRYASWGSRVVAHLLDTAVLGAVTYLTLPVQPVAAPTPAPFFGPADGAAGPAGWTDSPWVVLTVAVLALLQAYVGSTPGKLVVGIAVVRDSDGRPVGLGRTVVRWFAHLLDAVLYVGYLRPAWHPERRTFADSLLSTVVVLRADARAPGWWTGGRVRAGVAAAAVVCVAAAVFQLGPASVSSSGTWTSDCMVPGTAGSAGPAAGGSVVVEHDAGSVVRWGVTRRQVERDGWVEVRWERVGAVAAPGAYRLEVARPDGTGARTFQVDVVAAAADGSAELENNGAPIQDFWVEDASVVARFPATTFADLGAAWEWTLTSDAGGVVTGPCRGTAERWRA